VPRPVLSGRAAGRCSRPDKTGRGTLVAVCAGLLSLVLARAGAAEAATRPTGPAPAANAALQYWLAFAVLPVLNDEEDALVAQFATAPIDEKVEKVVSRSETALRLMHRGAALRHCDWGLNLEADGPGTMLPHLAKARQLCRLACLRARWRFERGEDQAAFDDLTAVFRLARHLEQDSILIGILVRIALERGAITVAAARLPRAKPEALRAFRDAIGALPPTATMKDAIEAERRFCLGWIRRKFDETGPKKGLAALLVLMGKDEDAKAVLKATGGTEEGLRKFLDEADAFYTELADLQPLTRDEFEPAVRAFEEKVEKANHLIKMLVPAVGRSWYSEAAARTKLAMLKAAIDVALEGKAALEKHKDPYGDGPFGYKALRGKAFELRSRLVVPKKGPVVLRVGGGG